MAPKLPTVLERLLILPNVGRVILAVILRLLARPFTTAIAQKSALKDALYAGIRTNLQLCTVAQEQYIFPGTTAAYKQLCWRNSIKADVQELKSGLKIHWIGSRTAKKTLLFFHGGGYVLPCTPGHWQFFIDLQKWLAKDGKDIAIAVPGYTLAPEFQYPQQIGQATEALEYLLVDAKKKPGDIFLGGDSAGGNLAIALHSHILHPHPQLKNISKLVTEPFAGTLLISPWVQWLPQGGSAETNLVSDICSEPVGRRWSTAYHGLSKSDEYQEPGLAATTWFENLPKITKSVIVWGGGVEMLIDSIVRFGKLVESVHPKGELVVQPGAGHEDFITCRTLHLPPGDDHAQLLKSWVAARL